MRAPTRLHCADAGPAVTQPVPPLRPPQRRPHRQMTRSAAGLVTLHLGSEVPDRPLVALQAAGPQSVPGISVPALLTVGSAGHSVAAK